MTIKYKNAKMNWHQTKITIMKLTLPQSHPNYDLFENLAYFHSVRYTPQKDNDNFITISFHYDRYSNFWDD